MNNINTYLQSKLIDLRFDIDKYKYNTKKKKDLEEQYNSLLKKIQQIDKLVEDIVKELD